MSAGGTVGAFGAVHRGASGDPRGALFNLDWVTLPVMVVIAVVGLALFLVARPWRAVARHVHDELEPTGAERHD